VDDGIDALHGFDNLVDLAEIGAYDLKILVSEDFLERLIAEHEEVENTDSIAFAEELFEESGPDVSGATDDEDMIRSLIRDGGQAAIQDAELLPDHRSEAGTKNDEGGDHGGGNDGSAGDKEGVGGHHSGEGRDQEDDSDGLQDDGGFEASPIESASGVEAGEVEYDESDDGDENAGIEIAVQSLGEHFGHSGAGGVRGGGPNCICEDASEEGEVEHNRIGYGSNQLL